MVIKSPLEPKDPRVIFQVREDNSVFDDKEHQKRKTGTEALVEFLNSTCPEEFQKSRSKRSTSLSLYRKTKMILNKTRAYDSIHLTANITTSTTADFVNRKNHIEIITNNTFISKDKLSIISKAEKNKIQEVDVEENNIIKERTRCTPSISMDTIEKGLKHRLNQYKTAQLNKPSDMIASHVAYEHTICLGTTISDYQQQIEKGKTTIHTQAEILSNKRKIPVRHVQVQTMSCNEDPSCIEPTLNDGTIQQQHYELTRIKLKNIENEARQEKITTARLEAALEATRDYYEALCGLAYKKLKEVWEEKAKWETACLEIKEHCWKEHQQQILNTMTASMSTHFSSSSSIALDV
ncbi:MAG: hypothetical protein EXX96DRAFT_565574 [Benjaminiella poitrasii]|nr:MAG: hypothetical protein EXX96DRAFT_565574 [Benjaminiella poitrasii]